MVNEWMDGWMDGCRTLALSTPLVAGGYPGLLFLNVNLNPFGFQLESYNSTSLENSILGRQQAQKATKMPESARAKDRKAGNSLKKLKKAELSTTG